MRGPELSVSPSSEYHLHFAEEQARQGTAKKNFRLVF